MRVQSLIKTPQLLNDVKGKKEKLNIEQKLKLIKLQQRDMHVRAHEAAHIAVGGSLVAGGATYTYQRGPDGKLYAVGGEVKIQIPKSKNPKENIKIARQVRAAALAPSNPSPQDLKVASMAMMMEIKAMQELNKAKNLNIIA